MESLRAGSCRLSHSRHLALLSDIACEFGAGEQASTGECIPFEEFEEIVCECQVSVQERHFDKACAQLRVIQNQIALQNDAGQQRAEMFLFSTLHLRLFDWIDDPDLQILCPYIVLIFVDLVAKCGFAFFERSVYNHVLEKVIHIWNMYPYIRPEISLLCYNLYYYAELSRHSTSYFAMRISKIAMDSVRDSSQISIWLPFALSSIMRGVRLVSNDSNEKFVNAVVHVINFTETPEVRRACLWSVYFWFKNGIQSARDRETDKELPRADQFLTEDFMIMISELVWCDDVEVLSITLYLLAWMWHLPKSQRNTSLLRHLEMHMLLDRVIEIARAEDNLISYYAILVLENYADFDSERCRVVLHGQDIVAMIDLRLAEGTTAQKSAASWLLCRLMYRGSATDLEELVTPDRLLMLLDQVAGADTGLTKMIYDVITNLLRQIEWVADFLLAENFDQVLLDGADPYYDGIDTVLFDCLQNRRQKIENGEITPVQF